MLPASEISLRQRIENRGPGRVQKGSAKNLEDFVFFLCFSSIKTPDCLVPLVFLKREPTQQKGEDL